MKRRVVVTGVGCVTPLGHSVDEMWQRLLKGESGVGYTTHFDASNFPTKISAEVKNWDIADAGEDPERWKYRGRHTPLCRRRCQASDERLPAWPTASTIPRASAFISAAAKDSKIFSVLRE